MASDAFVTTEDAAGDPRKVASTLDGDVHHQKAKMEFGSASEVVPVTEATPLPARAPARALVDDSLTATESGDLNTAAGLPGLAAALDLDATVALVTVEGGTVRWGTTTTPPTSSFGTPIADGGQTWFPLGSSTWRFIKTSGDPILTVGFWA